MGSIDELLVLINYAQCPDLEQIILLLQTSNLMIVGRLAFQLVVGNIQYPYPYYNLRFQHPTLPTLHEREIICNLQVLLFHFPGINNIGFRVSAQITAQTPQPTFQKQLKLHFVCII